MCYYGSYSAYKSAWYTAGAQAMSAREVVLKGSLPAYRHSPGHQRTKHLWPSSPGMENAIHLEGTGDTQLCLKQTQEEAGLEVRLGGRGWGLSNPNGSS